MAVWTRKPTGEVVVHSDQGSSYGRDDWSRFCWSHGLVPTMSRRGSYYDTAVAESFFSTLKKERVRRKIYGGRAEAPAELFEYIEVFENRRRRHGHLGAVSLNEFENAAEPLAGVCGTWGRSVILSSRATCYSGLTNSNCRIKLYACARAISNSLAVLDTFHPFLSSASLSNLP